MGRDSLFLTRLNSLDRAADFPVSFSIPSPACLFFPMGTHSTVVSRTHPLKGDLTARSYIEEKFSHFPPS